MNNIEHAINLLNGQCVRLDIKMEFPRYERMLIGKVKVGDGIFTVSEDIGVGKLIAVLDISAVNLVRFDSNASSSWVAVISVNAREEDYDCCD